MKHELTETVIIENMRAQSFMEDTILMIYLESGSIQQSQKKLNRGHT